MSGVGDHVIVYTKGPNSDFLPINSAPNEEDPLVPSSNNGHSNVKVSAKVTCLL